ncbi:hypothetical protein ARAM_007307 [Aspergillus rambellii]|uniref:Non-homologous end-joining factor 1 n=1 Tax=Aspergillus rambellii TaxID=308745 RepID=A0A0F8XL76_9EURO|nr:hypothetical protein ARAM_007307 [Aspergillus rambellii]
MPEKWQRLHLSNQCSLPTLLFRYSPTASGYEFYLTDLTYIWSESLNRRAILIRAEEDDTTIDPSEDLDQFKVLLQKIGDALNNDPESTTTLDHKTPGNALELNITSKLPAPLKPLEWTLSLSREAQNSTTTHLLLPFLKAEADRESRQQTLIEELHKKDWALGKLFDKIEGMGIDLSTIFPGTSGLRGARKGTLLEQATKLIKGVAPFDEQAWLDKANKSSPDSGLAANIVECIGGSGNPRQLDRLALPADEWWTDVVIPESVTLSFASKDDKEPTESKTPVDAMETDSDAGTETEDDEFERQETPPRLKKPIETEKKPPSPRKHAATETETDDDNEENEKEIPPPAMQPKPQLPAAKTKGLGTIGGKKQSKRKQDTPSPPLRTQTHQQHSKPDVNLDDDATTATNSGSDDEPPLPLNPVTIKKEPPPKSVSKGSRGLGVIGGKKKESRPEPESEPEHVPEEPPRRLSPSPPPASSETSKRKPLGKLGVIGGKRAKHSPGPSSSTPVPPSPKKEEDEEGGEEIKHNPMPVRSPAPVEQKLKMKEETEEERANRKREELKRQLEAKSKTLVKKKRRF